MTSRELLLASIVLVSAVGVAGAQSLVGSELHVEESLHPVAGDERASLHGRYPDTKAYAAGSAGSREPEAGRLRTEPRR